MCSKFGKNLLYAKSDRSGVMIKSTTYGSLPKIASFQHVFYLYFSAMITIMFAYI